jgi:hypothetical protein
VENVHEPVNTLLLVRSQVRLDHNRKFKGFNLVNIKDEPFFLVGGGGWWLSSPRFEVQEGKKGRENGAIYRSAYSLNITRLSLISGL